MIFIPESEETRIYIQKLIDDDEKSRTRKKFKEMKIDPYDDMNNMRKSKSTTSKSKRKTKKKKSCGCK